MYRIFIIGIVASGKTTLAKELSKELNIPYYELDTIVWNKSQEGRYKRTPEQQLDVIDGINKNGSWIIEGTYRESCHCLLDMADKIIFLDTPLWKRNIRIFTRFIKQKLKIESCHYEPNVEMLKAMYKWTKDFEKNRNEFQRMLFEYEDKLNIVSHEKISNIIYKTKLEYLAARKKHNYRCVQSF